MEQYIVSARKYRPSSFATVVGQQALTTTLKNAIATDRLAHAYLFCGSRGVGKTSCARIFAKTINCTDRTPDGEACNKCESCQQFNRNVSMNIMELDAASHNGIDDMKTLIEQVQVPPVSGKYRVFIIDEVHMLSTAAFNAFLKTLEEPPSYVIFILATTEKHKILPTILSRCQIYDFNRITIDDMVDHLEHVAASEGISAERQALTVIARQADGAMRDALSIFDQVAASSGGNITYRSTIDNLNVLDRAYYHRLLDAFVAGDVPAALLTYKEVRDRGFDSQFFINGLGLYMRDLMVAADPSTMVLLETTEDEKQAMAARSAKVSPTFLYNAMSLCNDADFNFRAATNKQFLVELTLVKLCQLHSPSPAESGSDEGHLTALGTLGLTAGPAVPGATPAPAAPRSAAPVPAPAVAAATSAPVPPPGAPVPPPGRGLQRPPSAPSVGTGTGTQTRTAVPTDAGLRNGTYTPDQVVKAWNDWATAHRTEPILASTMHGAVPVHTSGHNFAVTVSSDIQAGLIHNALPDIIKAIHNATGNDSVAIDLTVSAAEPSPDFWTESQVMNYIRQNFENVNTFIDEFKLRLF